MPIVSVVVVQENVHAAVREAMELAEWRAHLPAGADIALKPNLGWDLHLPGAVSAPWVVEAVIDTLRPHVGRIYLVEASQILVDVERALRRSGLDRVCREKGVEWVNMSRGKFVRVDTGHPVLPHIELPEILTRTALVTLPVMKTHGRTTITGAVKNQWGCLRELRHNYHPVVDEALAVVNGVVRPRFAVMDGTVGLEGNGPKSGRPKVADRILASADAVALDTVAARLMGFDPAAVAHLAAGARHGLGENRLDRIEVRGLSLAAAAVPFAPGRNNTVALVEMLLRRSAFRRLVFETPLLNALTAGAKLWYGVWYYLYRGRRYRRAVLDHPYYGLQWRPRSAVRGPASDVKSEAGLLPPASGEP